MSYPEVEGALLNILRTMTDWDYHNSARQDWTLLATGRSENYCILRPGEYSNEVMSIGQKTGRTTWNTIIEVWQKYDVPGVDPDNLQGKVDDIIREIEKYPYLNQAVTGAVHNAMVTDGGEMEEVWLEDGGPRWARWNINVQWSEERSITTAE